MPGCSIERELVIAARNSRKNQALPKNAGNGIFAKTSGSHFEARRTCLGRDSRRAQEMKAAGTVINPPKPTSQNSFAALALKPLSTTSSLFRR